MTQLSNLPLDVDFAGTYLQANGMEGPGNKMLSGISDRLEIINGSSQSNLIRCGPANKLRVQNRIRLGTFPNSGECWSSVDFMIDPSWTTNGASVSVFGIRHRMPGKSVC